MVSRDFAAMYACNMRDPRLPQALSFIAQYLYALLLDDRQTTEPPNQSVPKSASFLRMSEQRTDTDELSGPERVAQLRSALDALGVSVIVPDWLAQDLETLSSLERQLLPLRRPAEHSSL